MQEKYDLDDYNEILAWIAAGLTMLFYFPKIAPFINVIQGTKKFEDTPLLYTIMSYINSLFWFLYGDLLYSDPMRLCYMVSCILCLISMGIYLIFEIKKYIIDMILNLIILVSVSFGIYCYFTIDYDDDKFLGKICIITSIAFYLILIYDIFKAIKEKNSKIIHIYNITIYFFGSLCWFIYGIIDKDYFIAFPFCLGAIISLIQIILYNIYTHRSTFRLNFGKKLVMTSLGFNNKTYDMNNIEDEIKFKIKEKTVEIDS